MNDLNNSTLHLQLQTDCNTTICEISQIYLPTIFNSFYDVCIDPPEDDRILIETYSAYENKKIEIMHVYVSRYIALLYFQLLGWMFVGG